MTKQTTWFSHHIAALSKASHLACVETGDVGEPSMAVAVSGLKTTPTSCLHATGGGY